MAKRNSGNKYKPVKRSRKRNGLRSGLYFFLSVAWLFGMSAGLIFAYDIITQTDYFAAHQIDIVGNDRLSESEVIRQADLSPGVNIFSINLTLIRKQLLAHPWVASAKVVRKIPNRLLIQISEHVPLALIDLGRTFILNTEGEIFIEKSGLGGLDLPEVQGLSYSDIQSGGDPERDPLRAVMTVLKLGRKPGNVLSNRRIRIIQVDRQLGLTLYTFGDTAAIKLGYSDYPEKVRRLEKVLAFCGKNKRFKQLRFIDVNNVNRIVVHPIGGEATGGDEREA